MTSLLIAGAAIITVLIAIAAYYLIKLSKARKEQAQAIAKNKAAWQAHRDDVAADIRFIASSMVQGQCEITEGCLRLGVLMDRLDESLQHKPEFATIRMHFAKTIHMPTHDAYKALTPKQQFKLDQERFTLEEENKEQVLKEAKVLAEHKFEILQMH
ncbi:DUF2489 domain-containing protein [Bermanella sp. R86510]|uniref:DUF2489 domain-containing protein n=1 Tax=unclassified Bermanella TaxID=2627862 RepID=UPI0037C70487